MSILDAMRNASKELANAELNERYKTDIALWAKDKLGYTLWRKQIEIAEALLKYKRVAVKSGHGVGKSFMASVIIAWWVDTRKDLHSIAVSSAPVADQLSIIWESLREHHAKGNLTGRITLDNDWRGDDDSERAKGRKPSNTNQHAFQGVHRRNGVLAVLDEGCGIPETIFTAVAAITTGKFDAALVVGNPDDVNTPFGAIWKNNDPSWHKITINSYDSPNITGEPFPEEHSGGLVTLDWIELHKKKWGEDSPRFRSKILGEFSMDGTNALFPVGTLTIGRTTELPIKQDSKPRLGVDVARMGGDYTVVYVYQDGVLRFVEKWSKATLTETAARVVTIAHDLGVYEVRIDGVGIGAGVFEMVANKSEGRFETIAVIGNAASSDNDKWLNTRAEMYDTIRERMLNAGIDIDENDTEMIEELGDLEYHFKNNRSALQVASKEEIRAKTGKSPDFADAAAYAAMELRIDPTDPVNKMAVGTQFEVAAEEFMHASEAMISPY
jgi:hypothetical protein